MREALMSASGPTMCSLSQRDNTDIGDLRVPGRGIVVAGGSVFAERMSPRTRESVAD